MAKTKTVPSSTGDVRFQDSAPEAVSLQNNGRLNVNGDIENLAISIAVLNLLSKHVARVQESKPDIYHHTVLMPGEAYSQDLIQEIAGAQWCSDFDFANFLNKWRNSEAASVPFMEMPLPAATLYSRPTFSLLTSIHGYVLFQIIDAQHENLLNVPYTDISNEVARITAQELLSAGDKPTIKQIYEGALDRTAMARALESVMTEKGFSVRAAAEAAGVNKTDIQRIKSGDATLDKSAQVLKALGVGIEVLAFNIQ